MALNDSTVAFLHTPIFYFKGESIITQIMNRIGYKLVIVMGVAVLLSVLLMGTLGYMTSKNIIAEKVEREI